MGTENKVIRCKAAVVWEPGKSLAVEEVEVSPPKEHEVRIKIVVSSVCHTDWLYLRDCETGVKTQSFPLIVGHEGAGVVEGVGPGVTTVQPGDKVIILFLSECRECDYCLSQKTNHSLINREKTQQGVLADGTSRFTCKGQQVYQFEGVSTLSEYTVVPEHNVTRIHRDAPLDKVCFLGCGIAALNTGKVEHGSVCAVFGLGAVGLATVMGCKSAGAARIIGVDINAEKYEVAKRFGVTDFVNPNDHSKPIQEVLMEMTSGGVDYSFECVGNVTLMRAAFESCKTPCGTCVAVGWTENNLILQSPEDRVYERMCKGLIFGGLRSVTLVTKLVHDYICLLLDEGTYTSSLVEINHVFKLMTSGESVRSVIKM
ncbi:alcohol dehydrogenase class-3-like [Neoarius graeffei]|uniref:alcohol dehydrogenase class-3-like n=1 Tax=Neoarius graeffei TaxID=443677 RepID=UPI00298D1992|nr:alcohol dehydrogenase class-3-like [Neoarius graeffei]